MSTTVLKSDFLATGVGLIFGDQTIVFTLTNVPMS
jgi:hypothetical protein